MPGESVTCILCNASPGTDRLCGFDVCPRCRLGGDLEANLRRWGLDLEQRTWHETRSSGDQTVTVHCLEVTIALATPVDATAHFGTGPTAAAQAHPDPDATLWQRLTYWLSPTDLEVGDSLFDDAVFISEPGGEALRDLLADEGVQTAIMELVSAGGVRLGAGWLRLRRGSQLATPTIQEHGVPLALLAIHLETRGRLTAG